MRLHDTVNLKLRTDFGLKCKKWVYNIDSQTGTAVPAGSGFLHPDKTIKQLIQLVGATPVPLSETRKGSMGTEAGKAPSR